MIERLGKYRIDGIVGKGAMGVVYKGFDPGIERVVALKTIRKDLFSESEQADLIGRFKNEAQAAGRLNHPNIVTVYDYGEDAESAYIAMEFVDGATLDALLAPGRPTPVPHVLAWMDGLLGGLDYAHSRGVVHRDVKPANLLVTAAGEIKISDFGIAHIDASNLTRAGSMIGTPSYMSPEQFQGDVVDGRADVFSAGIVLYQMLTGARPFAGSASIVMQQILNEDPAPPSQVLPALGKRFDAVLAMAMAKQPNQRYPSAYAFREALLAVAREDALDSDATILADAGRTGFARAQQSGRIVAAAADDLGSATMPQWKREALPDIEASLAYQIGPMAKFLVKKAADKAEGIEQLSELLSPHIPSEGGRAQFRQTVAELRKKLDASRTGSSMSRATAAPLESIDEAYAGAAADRLVAIIGPIGRVLARRAMEQTGDKQTFLQLLAAHIDDPDQRTRFLAEAGAGPSPDRTDR
jgi:serine/threonine-protein kinase